MKISYFKFTAWSEIKCLATKALALSLHIITIKHKQ